MHNQLRLHSIPNSSSGNVLLGHIFDLQYDGYLQAHKIQEIVYDQDIGSQLMTCP